MGMRNASSPSARLGRLPILMLCLCVTGSVAEAKLLPRENRRSETREIEKMEEQWRTAVVAGDASSLEKLLSEDFLAISARGTLSDKQQYLHRISTHATQFSQFELLDLKVRFSPGSAMVVSQTHVAGTLESRPIEGIFRYTKVYSHSGGTWHITNFQATRVSTHSAESDMDRGTPLPDDATKRRNATR